MNLVKNFSFISSPFASNISLTGKLALCLGSLSLSQWFFSDIVHIPGGGIGLVALIGGSWWLLKLDKPSFNSPKTTLGWLNRCKEVNEQFEKFNDNSHDFADKRKSRIIALDKILERSSSQQLSFIGLENIENSPSCDFKESFFEIESVHIHQESPLPLRSENWTLPESLFEKDLIVYTLNVPMKAVDLLWINQLPADQPAWIMVLDDDRDSWFDTLKDLQAQLPDRWHSKILRWSKSIEENQVSLLPIRRLLAQPQRNLERTKQRLLSRIHARWQSELEVLRREKFKSIQNRSQWIVAGAVFTSPVPSTDLLSVAVVNGLMIQEMSDIWSCKFDSELLQSVAKKLACAAAAQGIVEWSTQALLGIAKLHGGTWLAAGSMQALSAAYLTRVVGRSMADWMALNNGVMEPDLKLLDEQASLLVSRAAEQERVDWIGFINQGKTWIEDQMKESNIKKSISPV